MALIDLLPKSVFGYKGQTPPTVATPRESTLHFESSINNKPSLVARVPSILDLDGKTPEEYKNNAPTGARV
jgi:hypothetical protein